MQTAGGRRLAFRTPSSFARHFAPAALLPLVLAVLATPVAATKPGRARLPHQRPPPEAAAALPAIPGGFLETAVSGVVRPPLGAAQLQALLPARGPFLFPPPYATQGARITSTGDCGGGNCVEPVGYSYWRNINSHEADGSLLILLGLNRSRGGGGPSLFRFDKTTREVTNLGPLFPASSPLSFRSAEGWYWSASRPTTLYLDDGPRLVRYDVATQTFETVFDASTSFGPGVVIRQMHSSDDDRVHSATLQSAVTSQPQGCVVYDEATSHLRLFAKIGVFNECHVDKSGRWLMSLEDVDGRYDLEMRIIDLQTGAERLVWDQQGAAGHADLGYGYVVGTDNWNEHANAVLLWDLARDPLSPVLVSHTNDWSAPAPNHIAHGNARGDLPPSRQFACGSGVSRVPALWANEIICFRLDGAAPVLVVAPVMTDPDAPGAQDDYALEPKGNLDVTGRYFLWTSNAAGGRLDAFLVEIPSALLLGLPEIAAPPRLLVSASPAAVAPGGTITYTLAYDNPGPAPLAGALLRDRLPEGTSLVAASPGASVSTREVSWSIGALLPGVAGAAALTVRVDTAPSGGRPVIHGGSVLDTASSASVFANPVSTPVIGGTAPSVASATESDSGSIYLPRGWRVNVTVRGAGFAPGAAVDLGAGIACGAAAVIGPDRLTVPVSVDAGAAPGARDLTITNPGGLSANLSAGLQVVSSPDLLPDCRVDGFDLNVLARAWNSRVTDPQYQATADLDGDGEVGPLDLTIFAEFLGGPVGACP
jgi:uncharacterized repeat protein (TIGR01451 family)